MKRFFLFLFAILALTVKASATNISIGSSTITGFNTSNAGVDTSLSNVSVTLDSTAVTCSSCLPQSAVGLSGLKVALGTPAVTYTIASVASRSSFTLASNYLASTGTVTGTLYKFVHLRIYAMQSFTPAGETFVVQAGTPGSSAWYRRYAVPIINDGAQNVAHVPEIELPATTDSSVPTARYFAGLYTQGGAFMQAYPGCVSEFKLDADTTPTSWSQICQFNSPANAAPPEPTNYYTSSQIDARFPSCTSGQMIYYAATGNVQSCLTPDASQFTISGGTLSVNNVLNRIQEEGSNLPQQPTLNFAGSSFTAADDAGNSRTNLTADSDLDALASTATTGLYNRTGAGTSNTITTSAGLAGVISDETGSGALAFGTAPTITGGTHTAITTLGIRSTGSGAFDLQINNTENLTANRALTFTLNDAAKSVNLGGNLSLTNSLTTMGDFALALTTTNTTNVTLPTTGTLATLAGTETFTNKTLTSPRIGTSILDANGNPMAALTATGSAVNGFTWTNATAGNGPILGAQDASGTDSAGVNLELAGGPGTGNAEPGQVVARYPLRGASGTTVQSLSTTRYPLSTALYTNTGAGTAVSNTVTETSLLSGATASAGSSLTIEAGSAAAGTVYRMYVIGTFATTGTPTIRFRLKLGGTTIADSTAVTSPNNSSGHFIIEVPIFVGTIGASGTVRAELFGKLTSATTGAVTPVFFVSSFAQVTSDFTAAQPFDLTAEWGTASVSNSLQLLRLVIERVR